MSAFVQCVDTVLDRTENHEQNWLASDVGPAMVQRNELQGRINISWIALDQHWPNDGST